MKKMKVVILCGGLGTRLREQTEYMPKPLVSVGNRPILWHIMKIYQSFGYEDFICCLGYKGEMIKQFFLNYRFMRNDFTINLGHNSSRQLNNAQKEEWAVTLADTGAETNTGGRIKKIEPYIDGDTFMLTYGDGLADIDINGLLEFHARSGKIATVTGVHPPSRFGIIETDRDGIAQSFREKPYTEEKISGGFFVLNRKVFSYLDENCIFEREPMEQLVRERELAVYEHKGFWYCMDTYRDYLELNRMWKEGRPAWKIWEE